MPRRVEKFHIPMVTSLLPKDRIGHCHCKDVVKKEKKYDWAPMGGGMIDWAGQFRSTETGWL